MSESACLVSHSFMEVKGVGALGAYVLWLVPLSVDQGPTPCLADTCDGIVTRCGIY